MDDVLLGQFAFFGVEIWNILVYIVMSGGNRDWILHCKTRFNCSFYCIHLEAHTNTTCFVVSFMVETGRSAHMSVSYIITHLSLQYNCKLKTVHFTWFTLLIVCYQNIYIASHLCMLCISHGNIYSVKYKLQSIKILY